MIKVKQLIKDICTLPPLAFIPVLLIAECLLGILTIQLGLMSYHIILIHIGALLIIALLLWYAEFA